MIDHQRATKYLRDAIPMGSDEDQGHITWISVRLDVVRKAIDVMENIDNPLRCRSCQGGPKIGYICPGCVDKLIRK